jgi:hypothetical protein
MIPTPLKEILNQIKTDTETTLRTILEDKHVLNAFTTMEDLHRFRRVSEDTFPNSIEADYLLDGEVVMMRRVMDGSVCYYGR